MNCRFEYLSMCFTLRHMYSDSSVPWKASVPQWENTPCQRKLESHILERGKESLSANLTLPCISHPNPAPLHSHLGETEGCCSLGIICFELRQTWIWDMASPPPPTSWVSVGVLFHTPGLFVSLPVEQGWCPYPITVKDANRYCVDTSGSELDPKPHNSERPWGSSHAQHWHKEASGC